MEPVRRRTVAVLAAATATASILTVTPLGVAHGAPAGVTGGGPQVTLVTGDRVTLVDTGGQPAVRVEPADGREGVGFVTQRRPDGHLLVVPSDAQPLLAADRLDERLFDVTQLVEWGYDDSRRSDLPLVFDNRQPDRAPGFAALDDTEVLPHAGLTAAAVDKDDTTEFWSSVLDGASARTLGSGAERIWLDGVRHVVLEHSVPQIGAPAAWEAGFVGDGVTVAVLDTGVDADHPSLAGRVAEARNFTTTELPGDLNGHGTHVASTIAGTDAHHRGVAPGATIISGKVLDDEGSGRESEILAGMEWAAGEADIINMSLGGGDGPTLDPLEIAVGELSARTDALFVVAAGNNGEHGAETISSPGSADAALTVGAVDRDGRLAGFSSRGPRAGDHALKPDITAPGVQITAAEAGTDGFVAFSGTSMAAPHVAGAAALLAQQHPDWDGERLKHALTATARPADGASGYDQGAGLVDVAAALDVAVIPDTASLSGMLMWPHDDDERFTRTLTYTNTGSQDVTLDLVLDDPTGMATVADRRLVVPAGGTARTTVSVTTSPDTEPGTYTSRLTATHPGGVIGTPVGVYLEQELVTVTVETVAPQGRPTNSLFLSIYGPDRFFWGDWESLPGQLTLRLPPGEYVFLAGFDITSDAVIVAAEATLDDEPGRVTLDGRVAEPVEILTDDPDARLATLQATVNIDDWNSTQWLGYQSLWFAPMTSDRVATLVNAELHDEEPITTLSAAYDLREDGIPADSRLDLRRRSLVPVETTIRSHGGGDQPAAVGMWPSVGLDWVAETYYPTLAPRRVTAYLSPGHWRPEFGYHDRYAGLLEPITVVPGRRQEVVLNAAVLGPAGQPVFRLAGEDIMGIYVGSSLFRPPGAVDSFAELTDSEFTVARDGEILFSGDASVPWGIRVPPERAYYTVAVDATRVTEGDDLSRRVQVEWGFWSGHVSGDTRATLPTLGVTFRPHGLDDRNQALANGTTPVEVRVLNPAGDSQIRELSVEVSHDGRTWRAEQVRRTGDHWTVRIRNPRDGSVSLRATAVDADGSRVRQTITDAYRVA